MGTTVKYCLIFLFACCALAQHRRELIALKSTASSLPVAPAIWLKNESLVGLDGDNFAWWPDSSGNNHYVTNDGYPGTVGGIITNNVLNSRPALGFYNEKPMKFLSRATNVYFGVSGLTYFMVLKTYGINISGNPYAAFQRVEFVFFPDKTTFKVGGTGSVYADPYDNSTSFTLETNWCVLTVVADFGDTSARIWTNTTLVITDNNWTSTAGPITERVDLETTHNIEQYNASGAWSGWMTEFIVYSNVLTDPNILLVQQYLTNKFGLSP